MSGILEQAIEFLQNQSKSMQTMIGSGGDTGSSGGIGSVLSQTPMGGGMDTAPTTQPSTMEIPTPSVTTPPPVTATLPVTTPPVNPSTPAPTPTPSVTAPTLGSSLGGLNPNPIPTGQGQNQFGSMTGNFNDPSRINAPTQGQAIFNNPVQGQTFGINPAMDQQFLGERPNPYQLMQQYQQARQTPTPMQMGGMGISGFGQMGLGGDPRFAGLGQMAGRPVGLGQMDQMAQRGGMNPIGSMNQLFGRAFAGKPI